MFSDSADDLPPHEFKFKERVGKKGARAGEKRETVSLVIPPWVFSRKRDATDDNDVAFVDDIAAAGGAPALVDPDGGDRAEVRPLEDPHRGDDLQDRPRGDGPWGQDGDQGDRYCGFDSPPEPAQPHGHQVWCGMVWYGVARCGMV